MRDDRGQADDIFAAVFIMAMTVVGVVTATTRYDVAISFGIPEFFATGIAFAGFVMGAVAPFLALLALAWVLARKEFPLTTFGVHLLHEADETEIEECLNCEVEDVAGYASRYGRFVVVFGITIRQLDGGVHYDCTACFEDPIEAALRRERTARTDRPVEPGDDSEDVLSPWAARAEQLAAQSGGQS